MSASFESSYEQRAGLSLAELPDSLEVAERLINKARQLWEDPDYPRRFYDVMGVVRTSLDEIEPVGEARVFVKKEYLQDSGSYKRRGATNAVMQLPAERYVSYSTGNHGLSLVKAANAAPGERHVQLEVTESITAAKLSLLEGNAELVFHSEFAKAQRAAQQYGELYPDVAVIDPFGHEDVIIGQYSVGHEIVTDIIANGLADSRVVIPVPVAGGGLLTGIALAVWQGKQQGKLGPNVTVISVQPENTDMLGRAVAKVQAGEDPCNLLGEDTLDKDCDALVIGEKSINQLTLSIAADRRFVDSFVTIPKVALAQARRYVSDQLGTEIEPAAALPMAYAMEYGDSNGEYMILPVTGSNISAETQQLYDSLLTPASSQSSRNESHTKYTDNTANALAFAALSRKYNEREVDAIEEVLGNARPHPKRNQLSVWSGPLALRASEDSEVN